MADSTTPSKRQRIDYSEHFTVKVGEPPKSYVLPTKTFAARSNFWKAALSSQWRTGDKPVELQDVKIKTFEAYAHCVTYDEIDLVHDKSWSQVNATAELYFLADRFVDVRTANLAIDHLLEGSSISGLYPLTGTLTQWFERANGSSPLRRLIVDWVLHEVDRECSDKAADAALSQDLLIMVYQEFQRLRLERSSEKVGAVYKTAAENRSKCYYHRHDADHPKC